TLVRFFRSRVFISQAALHPSCFSSHSAGPLRSTIITRFAATTRPADCQSPSSLVMHSPQALGSTQATGSPRFLISLSMRAVLNHPDRSNGCSRLLLHRRFQASSSWEACPPASYVTRPNQVHLRYSSHLRLPRLHGTGHPMLMLSRLHVEQAIHMAASFHAARSIRLSWHTKARQARQGKEEKIISQRRGDAEIGRKEDIIPLLTSASPRLRERYSGLPLLGELYVLCESLLQHGTIRVHSC